MDKAIEALERLAAKLGVAVDYLWPLLVRKTVVDWWAQLGVAVVFFAFGFGLWLWANRRCDRMEMEARSAKAYSNVEFERIHESIENRCFPPMVGGGLVCLASTLFLLVHLSEISAIFVPEAVTIQRLLGK